jgi:hypothetical protein
MSALGHSRPGRATGKSGHGPLCPYSDQAYAAQRNDAMGQYATSQRPYSGGMPAGFTPAGFFNWMVRLSLSRCSLYRASGTDLCEHRQHVEVVPGALELTTLDLDHLAGRHLDRLVRGRNGTCWCL